MKPVFLITAIITLLCMPELYADSRKNDSVTTAPNGLTIPKGYRKWKLVGVSHREDKQSLRAILGNRTAINAITSKTERLLWPEGTILAKLVWKDRQHPDWPAAQMPGKFLHIEFMFKDSKRFPKTGGWGFARWVGKNLEPYPNDGSECFSCHTRVREKDYVFTHPVALP